MGDHLPAKISMWGEPIKQTPEGRNRFLYHFIDPTKHTDIRDKEWSYKVYQLFMESKDKEALPNIPGRTITIRKKPIKLTSEEYSRYYSAVGKQRARLVKAIVESKGWDKLEMEKKVARLKKAYETGYKIGKTQFIKAHK